ncbi:MAG: tetratricopeptide repeat protein [Lewinellaceae bacterium]|nr:tetratricopeptide repeat protein [Lewinellaceae bacterium]
MATEKQAFIHTIKEKIGDGALEQSLVELADFLRDENTEAYDQVLHLRTQHTRLEQDRLKNLLSYPEYSIQLNNISFSLLKLCTQLQQAWKRNQSGQHTGSAVTDLSAVKPVSAGEEESLLQRGIRLYHEQDFAGAIATLEEMLQKDPQAADAAFYLGVIREETGDAVGAAEFYTQAVTANSHHSLAMHNIAVLLLKEESWEEALQWINRTLEENPSLKTGYLNRGLIYMNLENYELALADLNQAANAGIDLASVYAMRSLVQANLGNNKQALEDAERGMRMDADNFQHYFNFGLVTFREEKYRESIRYFSEALERNPEHYDSRRLRSMAYALIEAYDKATADLELLLAENPEDDQMHYWRGFIRKQQGDSPGAVEAYNVAIHLNPYAKAAYVNRGVICLENDLPKEALSDFKIAHELDPNWEIVPALIAQAEQLLKQKGGSGIWKKLFGG